MKFKITRKEMLTALLKVSFVNTMRSKVLDIFQNILIESKEGQVILKYNNMEIAAITQISAEVEEEGSTTLPIQELIKILKLLNSDETVIEFTSVSDKITLICQDTKTVYNLAGTNANEYPEIFEVKGTMEITVKGSDFSNAIKKINFASSQKPEQKLFLNGINFKVQKKEVHMAATDAMKLAYIKFNIDNSNEIDINVPTFSLNEITRFIEEENEVKIIFSSKEMAVKIPNLYVKIRLIEENFPDYDTIIPKKCRFNFKLDTVRFLSALKRINIYSFVQVNFDFKKDKVILSSKFAGRGSVKEEIEIENENKEEIKVDLNCDFLISILKNIETENFYLGLNDSTKPCLIKPDNQENYKIVIMPLVQ